MIALVICMGRPSLARPYIKRAIMKRTINFAFFNLPFRQRGIAVGASIIRREKLPT
jgi:hypothetical protein